MIHARSQHFCLVVLTIPTTVQASKTEEIPCKLVKPKPFLMKAPKIHLYIFKFTSLKNLTTPVGS